MNEIIIILIILQFIVGLTGYFTLSKKIRSTKNKIKFFAEISFLLPLLFYAIRLSLLFPNMTIEQVEEFFIFFILSILANSLGGIIVLIFEGVFNENKSKKR